ncbi:MAG: B12-binding domain-containing radical SAM protein [Acidobacteriota bacterium]|nr:B12-binding domain-containing radical SAM protein [Acidobacteriota bacterium]
MRILCVNPPNLSIGSRRAGEHLPPLGLLAVAGPLIDAGHEVKLLDADIDNMRPDRVAAEVARRNPDAILLGHSGSTSAQPFIEEITKAVREKNPEIRTIVGGVFPTFHWRDILARNPHIDHVVCGEGEAACLGLVAALESGRPLEGCPGVAFRAGGRPVCTPPAPPIENLDDYRVAWELMESYDYTAWGRYRGAVVQFSRGCPYSCAYCGQRLFWKKWRHRDPSRFAGELAMLHRKYGVRVVNFADENIAPNPKVWRELLDALIGEGMDMMMFGAVRADHIVRDADILPLYKKAGFTRLLVGIEHSDKSVLKRLNKQGDVDKDREAIRLLRKNDILMSATFLIAFGDETLGGYYRFWRTLLSYDADLVQFCFATPHRWTPFYQEVRKSKIILTDLRFWDYRHQILANQTLPAWLVCLYVKFIEITMHARPKSLFRLFFLRDRKKRLAMRWYVRIGGRSWFAEIFQFFFTTKLEREGVTAEEFWGDAETSPGG